MGVQIPVVHPTLSTGRVLVMDEVRGRSISDAAAIEAAPVARKELARRLLASFLAQILHDGYYHADPHPGNVLIDADGTLWLLDFGAVGRIDAISREALQAIALGFAEREGSLIARAVRHLVGDDQVDMRQLEREMSVLLGEVDATGLSPAAMAGVLDTIERHGLRPPRSMLLLTRTLITLEGTLNTIDPTFSLGEEAELIVMRDHLEDFGTPEDLARRELLRALPALRTLPEHAEALASQWRSGRLVLRTERYAGSDRTVVESWLNRILVAVAAGTGALTLRRPADRRRAVARQDRARRDLDARLHGPDRNHGAADADRRAGSPSAGLAVRLVGAAFGGRESESRPPAAGPVRCLGAAPAGGALGWPRAGFVDPAWPWRFAPAFATIARAAGGMLTMTRHGACDFARMWVVPRHPLPQPKTRQTNPARHARRGAGASHQPQPNRDRAYRPFRWYT